MCNCLLRIISVIILILAFLLNGLGKWLGIGDIIPTKPRETTSSSETSDLPSSEITTQLVTEPVTEPSTENTTVTEPVTEPSTEDTTSTTASTVPSTTQRYTSTEPPLEYGTLISGATEKKFAQFGGTGINTFTDISPANDGGFIASANTTSTDGDFASVYNSAWKGKTYSVIAKLSADGTVEWMKALGSASGNYCIQGVTTLNDGSFVAAGYVTSDDYTQSIKAVLVKYSSTGTLVWEKVYDGSNADMFNCIDKMPGGFVVGGKSTSTDKDFAGLENYGGSTAVIMSFNSDGELLWRDYYAGDNGANIEGICADGNGNVFAACITASTQNDFAQFEGLGKGYVDSIVLKYDADGAFKWGYVIGTSAKDEFTAIAPDEEGGCVIGGHYEMIGVYETDGALYDIMNYGGVDAVLIRLNALGSRKWIKTVAGYGDDRITDIAYTSGGFIVTGQTTSANRDFEANGNQGEYDSFVLMITPASRTVKLISHGGSRNDTAVAVSYTAKGGALVLGQSLSQDVKFNGMNSHLSDAFLTYFANYYGGYMARYIVTM